MRGITQALNKIAEMAGKGDFLGCDIFKLWAFETKMKIMKFHMYVLRKESKNNSK